MPCQSGGGRVHWRRVGAERALCGLEMRGPQPLKTAAIDCFSCGKRVRDTERPPMPAKDTAPVAAQGSKTVHLAHQYPFPQFCAPMTLCGKRVSTLLAIGPSGVSCAKCAVLAKASA